MIEPTRPTSTAAPRRSVLLVLIPLMLAGCAVTQNVQRIETLESTGGEEPTILLMPPDIRYYLITAGGVPEPQAEWTEAARRNFSAAVRAHAEDAGTELEVLDEDMSPIEIQYRKLHEAVGYSVMTHHFGAAKLPSKDGRFDWTLGPGISEIAEEHDADYALFAFYRDEQATGGRMAIAILAAAATGVAMDTGGEYGFASLVDLGTGNIVWFNVVGAGSGELRDPDGARAAVETLFRDIPTIREL